MQFFIHYGLHFIYPIFVAYYFYKHQWPKVVLLLWATMCIDLDHLLVQPIFDAHRCSVGFHLFHNYWMIPVYIFMLFLPKNWSIIGLGLCMHIITDSIDCMLMGA
jgi:Family of unknown function (DUF6122)